MQAAIEAALARSTPPTLRRLGIDETSFRRPGRFATGFVDLDTGRLVDLVEGRSKSLVSDWLAALSEDARAAIVEVALDPYAGYNAAEPEALPHARITIDKFHAIRLANQAVTAVPWPPRLPPPASPCPGATAVRPTAPPTSSSAPW
ncbi:MAG TPA: transposase [Acidimicrobiales bacterium]|nr:transposase [Acidimicrobiales bacterium]